MARIKIAGTPVPNVEVERRSLGSSEVNMRKMTDEDWEKYGPLNSKKVKSKRKKEVTTMGKKTERPILETHPKGLTKDKYLEERGRGKTNAQIEREWGLSLNSIYPWLKKWGITANRSVTKEKTKVENKSPDTKLEPENKPDNVNQPAHYTTGGIETIDFMKAKLEPAQFEGYLVGNVIKYISRYRHKNGAEDLRKAAWYLDKLIEVKS